MSELCVFTQICMYVCMYVRMYVCMYVYMYVCMYCNVICRGVLYRDVHLLLCYCNSISIYLLTCTL